MVKNHINDFPNELLTEIFQRLESKDLETVKYVCQRWRVVANETVGVERYLGRRTGFFPVTGTNYDWYPLEAMLTEGICKTCISIQSAPLGIYNEEDEDLGQSQSKYPVFWAPFLVSRLTLYGDISKSYFTRLVSPLINLTELEIHISTLSTLMQDNPQKSIKDANENEISSGSGGETVLELKDSLTSSLDLHSSICSKRLRTLRVSMKGFEFWHLQMLRPSKMSRCIENLYNLLNGVFPRLQRFELGFPFFWDKESDLTKALSRFLHAHHNSLKHLSLEFHYYWRLEDKSFEEMSIEDMNAYADIFELPELTDILNLKSFNIDITDKRFIVPSIFYWEKLMLQQESLEFLKYKSGYHCSLPKCLIERNCRTLKAVCMTVRANSVLPVDCKILGKCENLEKLELDGGLRLVHQVIGDTRGPHIINTLCLPQTLTRVRLCSIFIESGDADHICLGLRHLKSLHMEDVGQTDGLGLRFSTLCKIFDRKQLNSFKIAAALNEISLDNAKKNWEHHSTFQSLLMVLATFYELPKMVKREQDDCYIAEIAGVAALPVLA